MTRSRQLVIAGGVAGTVAAGGAVTVAARAANRFRRRRRLTAAPWGAAGLRLPTGEQLTVTTNDGVDLAVTVAGPADAPTVVLAHCWTGSQAVWGAVARRLVLGGHRVVLYDHRAHGASTVGPMPPSIQQLGADLRAVLEQLDLTDVVLTGHSILDVPAPSRSSLSGDGATRTGAICPESASASSRRKSGAQKRRPRVHSGHIAAAGVSGGG